MCMARARGRMEVPTPLLFPSCSLLWWGVSQVHTCVPLSLNSHSSVSLLPSSPIFGSSLGLGALYDGEVHHQEDRPGEAACLQAASGLGAIWETGNPRKAKCKEWCELWAVCHLNTTEKSWFKEFKEWKLPTEWVKGKAASVPNLRILTAPTVR